MNERVDKRKEYRAQMARLIIDSSIPKRLILKDSNEGALVGLIWSLRDDPNINDKDLMFENYKRATDPFPKHTFLEAIIKFIETGLIAKSEYSKVSEINNVYRIGADADLINRINLVEKAMEKHLA